ncbi:MAG: ABC transporter ATP-binding protein [Clostridia bacterium]|nr:ABC transporter ATP-binding protein [Clostridia bacterium]
MSLLTVTDLSYSYGKKPALDGINLTLEEGSVNVLLGNNGSGKSTLLKLIAGILKTKKGKLTLLDKDVKEYSLREYARLVSYVPQAPTFDSSTVVDAVLVGRLPNFTAPKDADYEKVYESLDALAISHLALENVKDLSGGERQKVALCRALCNSSRLVLLDEPTNNLDIKSKYGVLNTMKKLSEQGICVLTSMHDLNESLDVGDRYFLLSKHRLVGAGDRSVLTESLLSEVYGMDFETVRHSDKIHFHIKEKKL